MAGCPPESLYFLLSVQPLIDKDKGMERDKVKVKVYFEGLETEKQRTAAYTHMIKIKEALEGRYRNTDTLSIANNPRY